jgi:retron-type reverse transcriptase
MQLDILKNVKQKVKYHTFPITKKSGKIRWIDAPSSELKTIQRYILYEILYRFDAHPMAMGFIKGKSVKDGASMHVGNRYVISLDIENFFPSVKKPVIIKLFHYIAHEYNRMKQLHLTSKGIGELRDTLVQACVYKGRLPQGACTSPALANLAMKPMDEELLQFADANSMQYTRYADDLTFSGVEHVDFSVIDDITDIVNKYHLKINKEKTYVRTNKRRMMVTGVVINKKPNCPKYLRRKLRAKLHNLASQQISLDDSSLAKLRGQIEWVRSLNNVHGDKLLEQYMQIVR